MIVTGIFKGKNTLGYVKGETYTLKIPNTKGMTISRLDGTGVCPYESLSSFLKNWSNVTVTK